MQSRPSQPASSAVLGAAPTLEGPSYRAAFQPLAFLLAAVLQLAQQMRGRAEDVIAYRYENYREDAGRVAIDTQTAYFEATLSPRVAVKGQFVYDAISGATPTVRVAHHRAWNATDECNAL